MAMSDDMMRDIKMYAASTIKDCEAIAKEVQKEMKKDIKPVTPRRDYDLTGPEDRVAREIAATKGHLQDGWVLGQIKAKRKGSAILKVDSKYFGVRSKNKPMLVHLLEFSRYIVLWGRRTGRKSTPKPFVDDISAKGQAELERRLDQYFK